MHAAVLRYFDQVARLGSIRRAAEALHVASSAVNRQIIKLEAEIGTPLFERLRSGVRLTAAGELLLRHSRETLADFERTRLEIAGLAGTVTGHVRIVCLESLLLRFMPTVVAELAEAHPQMTLTVIGIDPGDTAEEMRSGRNDFGVLFADRRLRGVEASGIVHTSIGAVMRPDHPLATRRSLSFTDCAAYPVVMLYDRWLIDLIMATEFAESGKMLMPRLVSNSIEFMRRIIELGIGIGFFTPIGFIDEIERGELVHVTLAEPLLADSAIAILAPRGREATLPARIAMDVIRRRLGEFAKRLPGPMAKDVRRKARAR
ncbi:MAG: LysR family transcriptional regulator [Hyphomicrobiales bacterium]|nr:LysR family transcriptional regulator [Hyphomicrobiales bacterium]